MTHTGSKAKIIEAKTLTNSHYGTLGLHPSASVLEVRRAYRELSKKYHPDTTQLPQTEAKSQFQRINEAYATLSNPDRRSTYDLQIGYSRLNVIQAPNIYNRESFESRSSYLDPTDRPLSSGEIFALFLMGLTFVGCLGLVVILAAIRGEEAWQLPTTAADLLTIYFF